MQSYLFSERLGVMSMNSISRWMIAVVLILVAGSLFNQGLDLQALGTNVDGDGIGIYFLAFEINGRVPEGSIPSYAVGFFLSSLVAFFIAATCISKNVKFR